MRTTVKFDQTIAATVERGLLQRPKRLPSWLFYNEKGDQLFQQIMKLPEYYLTRCEHEILDRYKEVLFSHFSPEGEIFNLVELGAGDATKTEILLRYFLKKGKLFWYSPVDISRSVLDQLKTRLTKNLPHLDIRPVHGTYEQALHDLRPDNVRKIVLFLGASIGNFTLTEAAAFMKKISGRLNPQDGLLIGFDLKKDPNIILSAYNDSQGITKQFNLNLLTRLNESLGANFDLSKFIHSPVYNPETGSARSYLVSTVDQYVHVEALERLVHFGPWETLHTEISQKYDLSMISAVLDETGLEIEDVYYDSNTMFCDVFIKKTG